MQLPNLDIQYASIINDKAIIGNIKDTFDDAMKSYIGSPVYQAERQHINDMFSEFRSTLSPEQASCFNDIINAIDNSNNQLALEAFTSGVVNGIYLHDKYAISS